MHFNLVALSLVAALADAAVVKGVSSSTKTSSHVSTTVKTSASSKSSAAGPVTIANTSAAIASVMSAMSAESPKATSSSSAEETVTVTVSSAFSAKTGLVAKSTHHTSSTHHASSTHQAKSSTIKAAKKGRAVTTASFVNVNAACATQPSLYSYIPSDTSALGYLADTGIYNVSLSAVTPPGYIWSWAGFYASLQQSGYLFYNEMPSYSPAACAAICDASSGCVGFTIYQEREPTLLPAAPCPNPAPQTGVRCAYYSTTLNSSFATNVGQWKSSFAVVISGGNGYNKIAGAAASSLSSSVALATSSLIAAVASSSVIPTASSSPILTASSSAIAATISSVILTTSSVSPTTASLAVTTVITTTSTLAAATAKAAVAPGTAGNCSVLAGGGTGFGSYIDSNNANYTLLCGYDLYGAGDIGVQGLVANFSSCFAMCDSFPGCQAFAYTAQTCYFKSLTGMNAKPNQNSGVAFAYLASVGLNNAAPTTTSAPVTKMTAGADGFTTTTWPPYCSSTATDIYAVTDSNNIPYLYMCGGGSGGTAYTTVAAVANWETCFGACDSSPGCSGFTYNIGAVNGNGTGQCLLKNLAPESFASVTAMPNTRIAGILRAAYTPYTTTVATTTPASTVATTTSLFLPNFTPF